MNRNECRLVLFIKEQSLSQIYDPLLIFMMTRTKNCETPFKIKANLISAKEFENTFCQFIH